MQGKDKEGEEVQGGGGGLQGWPQPFPGIGELEPLLNFSITPLQAAQNMSNRGEKFERGREERKSWGGGHRGEGDRKYSGGDRSWSRGDGERKSWGGGGGGGHRNGGYHHYSKDGHHHNKGHHNRCEVMLYLTPSNLVASIETA